jgi:hypothetical protein
MKRFIFKHKRQSDFSHPDCETGYAAALRFGKWAIVTWCGYGKPVWWKPRFSGKGSCLCGFGFGWLLLCFRVHVIELKKEKV